MKLNSSSCRVRRGIPVEDNHCSRTVCLASVLEDPNNREWVEMDKKWLREQQEEFKEMDENKDGVLSKGELLVRPTDPILCVNEMSFALECL